MSDAQDELLTRYLAMLQKSHSIITRALPALNAAATLERAENESIRYGGGKRFRAQRFYAEALQLQRDLSGLK